MKPELILTIQLVAVFAISLTISYGLAHTGHPSSVWLWRDVLGVMH